VQQPQAADVYAAGLLAGSALPLLLGVVLVVLGVRRRRATRPLPWRYEGPSWGAAAEAAEGADQPGWLSPSGEPAAPPPPGFPAVEPVQRRGTGLILGGIALAVVSLVALGVQTRSQERRVALPTAVLGLARDQAASRQISDQALASVPGDLIDPQAAIYGELPQAVLVIAARAHTSRPANQLDGFRTGLQKAGGTLTNGRDVDAGSLGGAARCWQGAIAGAHPDVCVFVDRGSLVATVDFLGGGLPAAARRGLQIREATVKKAG
jgi:hypothetical protein